MSFDKIIFFLNTGWICRQTRNRTNVGGRQRRVQISSTQREGRSYVASSGSDRNSRSRRKTENCYRPQINCKYFYCTTYGTFWLISVTSKNCFFFFLINVIYFVFLDCRGRQDSRTHCHSRNARSESHHHVVQVCIYYKNNVFFLINKIFL